MIFNDHTNLKNTHSIFSPSNSAWLRYDDAQLTDAYFGKYKKDLGSEIHEYCECQIKLLQKVYSIKNLIQDIRSFIYTKYRGTKFESYGMLLIEHVVYLPKEVFDTVKLYINDAIGFKMDPEIVLFYSKNFFGTTDTISFRDDILRISDLKTGTKAATMEQLKIYAALFCLEYKIKPHDILIELRIYQFGDIQLVTPEADEIMDTMNHIIHANKVLEKVLPTEY